MRTFVVASATVILLLAAGYADAGKGPAGQERAALNAANRALQKSFRDPDKFASFFAPHASVFAPGIVIEGQAAIREFIGDLAHAEGTHFQLNTDRLEVAASGDIGYTRGTWQLSRDGVSETGLVGAGTESGTYLTIWEKQGDGTWLIVEDFCVAQLQAEPLGQEPTFARISADLDQDDIFNSDEAPTPKLE